MKHFQIYKHPFYGFECVKIGFSWPAFFFGIIWMLVSGLWINAALWIGAYILTIYISGTHYGNLSILMLAIAISFALWMIPAFQGNNWRISNLNKRGFQFQGIIQANSKDSAKAIALSESQNVQPQNVQPQNVQPQNVQPQNVQPQNVQPQNVQPQNVQPQNVQPQNVQPQNVQPQNVQPQNVQPQNTQIAPLDDSELFFSKTNNQNEPSIPLIQLFLIVAGLIAALVATKPNDAAFMSYLLNSERIQAEILSQIDPGDTLSKMALIEEIFSIVANEENQKNVEPSIIKNDYVIFTLYSAIADIKPNRKGFNNFSSFKKMDAAQIFGFNSTYVGIAGTFYRVSTRPLAKGMPVNYLKGSNRTKNNFKVSESSVDDDTPDVTQVETDHDGKYINERYQYQIKYPKDYVIGEGESDNGDGQKFHSKNYESRLIVFGSHALNTLESEYETALSSTVEGTEITDQKLNQNSYVVSSTDGKKVYYKKTIQVNDKFVSLILEYPTEERKKWIRFLEKVEINIY